MIRRSWPSDQGDDERAYRKLFEKSGWAPDAQMQKWRRRFFWLLLYNIGVGIVFLGLMRGWW
jgi:hypothetical protein